MFWYHQILHPTFLSPQNAYIIHNRRFYLNAPYATISSPHARQAYITPTLSTSPGIRPRITGASPQYNPSITAVSPQSAGSEHSQRLRRLLRPGRHRHRLRRCHELRPVAKRGRRAQSYVQANSREAVTTQGQARMPQRILVQVRRLAS